MKKYSRGYLKFDLRDSEFRSPLDEFEKVCHLRHGLVHNAGVLPGRNAVQIGARNYRKPVRITLNFGGLQSLIAAIDTLVLTFNRELFGVMSKRWATTWRQRTDWNSEEEEKAFNFIWKAHFCRKLHAARPGRSRITRAACLSKLRNQYDLQ